MDFEPVKAKAAGATAFPSMPQPVFDALPTRFVDSDIGPVPEGWEVKAIGDVVTLKGGGTPVKNSEYWDDGSVTGTTVGSGSHRIRFSISEVASRLLHDVRIRFADATWDVSAVRRGHQWDDLAMAGVPTVAQPRTCMAMTSDGRQSFLLLLNWRIIFMD